MNTEAKYLMLRHAFEVWGCVRVELKTDALNEKSRNAILRIGAKEEGTLRRHVITWTGRIRDSVYFSILDDEWPEVKAKLETRLVAPSHVVADATNRYDACDSSRVIHSELTPSGSQASWRLVMETAPIVVAVIVGIFVLGTILSGFFQVRTAEAAVVQRMGKFQRVAGAGINFKLPWLDQIAGRIDLRVQQLALDVETKTKDNVFVNRRHHLTIPRPCHSNSKEYSLQCCNIVPLQLVQLVRTANEEYEVYQ